MVFVIVGSVLKRKKYSTLAIVIALIMAGMSYALMVWNVAFRSISIYAEMNGFWFTFISLLLSLTISALLGIYAALAWVWRDIRSKMRRFQSVSSSTGGLAIGILATGCPSCGVPILGLLGAPLALTALPFRGSEVKLLSVVLILLSIYLICENIQKQLVCALDTPSLRGDEDKIF